MQAVVEQESASGRAIGEFIAKGPDSYVFRFGSRVIKFYRGHIDKDRLAYYQRVTRDAMTSLESRPHRGEMVLQGATFTFDYSINPILEVSEMEGVPIAISRYVPGPTFVDAFVLGNGEVFERNLGSIEKQDEREFLKKLYREDRESLQRQFHHSHRLSSRLRDELGLPDIRIGLDNVKMRVGIENRQVFFIVTDLYGDLRKLKQ